MNRSDSAEERPLAWNAILEFTPVCTTSGDEVGVVEEVLGAEDIFHGIVLRAADPGILHVVPADQVTQITNRKIVISLTPDQVRALPAYEPEASFALGIVGLFRKHLGWVGEHERKG